jgi:hypothetical protein
MDQIHHSFPELYSVFILIAANSNLIIALVLYSDDPFLLSYVSYSVIAFDYYAKS